MLNADVAVVLSLYSVDIRRRFAILNRVIKDGKETTTETLERLDTDKDLDQRQQCDWPCLVTCSRSASNHSLRS